MWRGTRMPRAGSSLMLVPRSLVPSRLPQYPQYPSRRRRAPAATGRLCRSSSASRVTSCDVTALFSTVNIRCHHSVFVNVLASVTLVATCACSGLKDNTENSANKSDTNPERSGVTPREAGFNSVANPRCHYHVVVRRCDFSIVTVRVVVVSAGVVLVVFVVWVVVVKAVVPVEVRRRRPSDRMLNGLCQWLMDNVRYFQDDDLMAEQIMQCKEAFSVFDKYGRGAIPVKDLKDVMRYLGLNPTENDIIAIMADLDLESTSKIKLNDFIQVVLERMRAMDTEEEIRKVFKVFDKDNNGLLNAAELKYMMTNMGHKFTDEEVDELMRGADINGDGHLNYEEFVQMLLS